MLPINCKTKFILSILKIVIKYNINTPPPKPNKNKLIILTTNNKWIKIGWGNINQENIAPNNTTNPPIKKIGFIINRLSKYPWQQKFIPLFQAP